jgi:hypothetical protein
MKFLCLCYGISKLTFTQGDYLTGLGVKHTAALAGVSHPPTGGEAYRPVKQSHEFLYLCRMKVSCYSLSDKELAYLVVSGQFFSFGV